MLLDGGNSRDPGKQIFNISRTDTSNPEKWVEEVEQQASKIRGQKTRFTSLEQTAKILIEDFDHLDLGKYVDARTSRPPSSIAQAANGGPLNCVGRIATLVTAAEVKGLSNDLYGDVIIGVNVAWKGLGADKKVKGGHIYGYVRGTGGNKTYLGKPQDMTATETYRIDMLPSFYKASLALAIGLEGDEKHAKQLASQARKEATQDSPYLQYFTKRIIDY